MGTELHKVVLSLLLAGTGALLITPPAHANRGGGPTTTTTQPGYVPPPQYGQNPFPQLPDEPNPYAPTEPTTVVPVELPAITDPGAGLAGGGEPLAPPPTDGAAVLDPSETQSTDGGGFMGGILSRTGSESFPLARAGLATLALGVGLVVLARRRRVDPASA